MTDVTPMVETPTWLERQRQLADGVFAAAAEHPDVWDGWVLVAKVRILQQRAEATRLRTDRIMMKRAVEQLDQVLGELNLVCLAATAEGGDS